MCLLDKKAFGAENRRKIELFLTFEGMEWTLKSADIVAAWKALPKL